MRRIIAFALCGVGLAGCTAGGGIGTLLPGMETKPPATELRLESNPPGAQATTSTQQSCKTPCTLMVATDKNFRVAFQLEGYQPAETTVEAVPPIDPRTDYSVHFSPNPVP